ncbi:hypothetical protein HUJ04_011801 [Dendroctonus ponderosae]|nr:hypothetical protein HUJ04_011801 [Dendroctonus ponderosae]
MENVYDPESYGSTDVIDFDKYFKEYRAECTVNIDTSKDVFTQRMEILKSDFDLALDLQDVKALEQLCSIEKLKVLSENEMLPLESPPIGDHISITHPINDRARTLNTAKWMEEFTESNRDLVGNQNLPKIPHFTEDKAREDTNYVPDMQADNGFICKVLVYRVNMELTVVHTTTLMELADSIKCATDAFAMREVENMDIQLEEFYNNKEKCPSRCFFIENAFYNDMTHPDATDYSEVVREWALENKIGNLHSTSMEGVTVGSLKFRLGYGYVYIHQGRCEHVICFSDIRLLKTTDCLVSKIYPKIVAIKRILSPFCFICKITDATWLILHSDRLPIRRAFFCTKSCKPYMFEDGKKVRTFQLYPYHHEAFVVSQNPNHFSDSE